MTLQKKPYDTFTNFFHISYALKNMLNGDPAGSSMTGSGGSCSMEAGQKTYAAGSRHVTIPGIMHNSMPLDKQGPDHEENSYC